MGETPDPAKARASRPGVHPLGGDLYTPINQDVWDLLARMRARHGVWREVAYISGTRMKVLWRLRTLGGSRKVVSMGLLDRLITTTGVGSLDEFTWFTADDLVAMGIWDAPADPVDSFPTEWKENRRKKKST